MRFPFLLLLVILGAAACKKRPEKVRPTLGAISESVYASGIIRSKNQYQVFATTSGLIQKIFVQAGDTVRKGDPLFSIDNETSKLNTDNARLAAEFARANLAGDRLRELNTIIETAASRMMNDSLLLVRQRGLWAQQIGSQVELEQRELAYSASRNNYLAALARYRDLQQQLRFSAAQSGKQLAISRELADQHLVRSQTDGRVYSVNKETGEMVNPQTPVAVVGAANDFLAELQIDENDIVRIRPGQRVLVVMDSYKGQVFEARVTEIDPIMNERSRTFRVEAEFTRQPPTLYPNLTLEANLVIQTKANALTIPRSYLVGDSAVILENKTSRKVELGLKDYQRAEITSGLGADETILKPGQ